MKRKWNKGRIKMAILASITSMCMVFSSLPNCLFSGKPLICKYEPISVSHKNHTDCRPVFTIIKIEKTIIEPVYIPDDVDEEILMGEIEMVAQMVQAEAGNQDLMGKRLVADVIYNRVESSKFPDQNNVEEVLFADGQFGPISNGAFEKAGWNISSESFQASYEEYYERTNEGVLYFNGIHENGTGAFKHGGHWFSY